MLMVAENVQLLVCRCLHSLASSATDRESLRGKGVVMGLNLLARSRMLRRRSEDEDGR
jgi:hypothetical protein